MPDAHALGIGARHTTNDDPLPARVAGAPAMSSTAVLNSASRGSTCRRGAFEIVRLRVRAAEHVPGAVDVGGRAAEAAASR